MYDLIVIGAGPGGYEAAAHAGSLGKSVALVERQYIGGTCLNVGCIPTKTMLRSSHCLKECRDAEAYGVQAGAPTIDMAKVQERKRKVVETLTGGVEGMLKRAKVEIIRGEATITAPGKVQVDGKELEAANILIATGSRPATPPIPGLDGEKVLNSTSILDLDHVPESLVVIGGGFIGLEFACFFNEVGAKVTVIEMLPQIAAGTDGAIAKKLLASLKKAGITFHLNSKVQKVEGGNVTFTDGEGKEQSASGTYVLAATGRTPVMDNLGLEAIGVDVGKKGIIVDDQGKTNVPGIWACGDVTGRCLLAHAATREGLVSVNTMFGHPDRMRYTAIPGVVYTHPECASVGLTEEAAKEQGIEYKVAEMPFAIAGRFTVEHEGESGTVKVIAGARDEILGVHMIGGQCGELIAQASMMIETEMRVAELEQIIYPHPTVSEALKETIVRGLG